MSRVLIYLTLLLLTDIPTATASNGGNVDFTRDIRPILSQYCFACHGPNDASREGRLSLVTHQDATVPRRRGKFAIVPGNRDASRVWQRITDTDDPMPPPDAHHPLSVQQIELIGRWIDQGAAYAPYWAWVPPKPTDAPVVTDPSWPRDAMDHHIFARLESDSLTPNSQADRVTLLRRLSFDLTGLPPSPESIDAYLADDSEDAWAHAVDRQLASDRYGERMATWWLDLVRFADTVGYHGDQTHRIWPYRDWVIKAFNTNMPFDAFTVAQLAGDLLDDPTQDDLVATGYNRLIQTSHEGGVQLQEYRTIYMADRVRNASAVWMGASLGCAQCHDHKYDPFTARDYHTFGAFFADVDDEEHLRNQYGGLNTLPTRRTPEMRVYTSWTLQASESLQSKLTEAKSHLQTLEHADSNADDHSNPDEDLAAARGLVADLQKQQQALLKTIPLTMYTKPLDPPREVRILPRGNWLDDSGEIVQPAIPAFMGTLDTTDRATRLDLARWLTKPHDEGGMGESAARVVVNRLWAMLMGNGLCPSLDDFGGQGQPPTHPELLDQLAIDLVKSNWDIKAMLRRIAMSSTYRQSSTPTETLVVNDPDNHLFGRHSPRRLTAEMVRDNALSLAGLLVHQIGGTSVTPPQPADYYKHLNYPKRTYGADGDEQQWRRSVYVHWQRQFLHPMLRAFDAPMRQACTARRIVSNTPLASLAMLNDPVMVEAARSMAQAVLKSEASTDRDRITLAFRMATARVPDSNEVDVLIEQLGRTVEYFQTSPEAAIELLSIGSVPMAANQDVTELAAWSETMRTILNLHETITRD